MVVVINEVDILETTRQLVLEDLGQLQVAVAVVQAVMEGMVLTQLVVVMVE